MHGVLASLAASAAALIVVSGLAKIRRPAPAATMLNTLAPRLRRVRTQPRHAVRAAGLVEVAVGAAFLATGSRWASALLAAAYLVFTVIALRLVREPGPRTSCGCFGGVDSPVGVSHVVLDLVALAAAGVVLARPTGAVGGALASGGTAALVGCAQVALLAWLGYLSITALPALAAARRLEEAR